MTNAPEPPTLELRVHGVSGTPPEDLLDRPLVVQVAGDRIAGFYRPRLAAEDLDDRPDPYAPARPGAAQLEGYNWGGLTSGSPGRAFWLLLLPFTLINVAPRSRPAADDARSAATRWIWCLARLLALLLTVLYVLTAAGIGEDLIGWQCAGRGDRCAKGRPHWLFDLIGSHHLTAGETQLIGASVPVATLLLLWFVSFRTFTRYERTAADLTRYATDFAATEDAAADIDELGLASPLMWRNEGQVRRLRGLHLQCGFAVVLWTLAVPSSYRWALAIAPAGIAVYSVVMLCTPGFVSHRPGPARASRLVWLAVVTEAVILVAGPISSASWSERDYLDPHDFTPAGALPFYGPTVLGVFIGVLLALLVFVVLIGFRGRPTRTGTRPPVPAGHAVLKPALFGVAAAAFASLGVFLAAAFCSGAYTYAATWLRTGSLKPGFADVAAIYQFLIVPDAVRAANEAYAWAVSVLLVALAVTVLWFVVVYRILPGFRDRPVTRLVPVDADDPTVSAVDRDYRLDPSYDARSERARQIQRAVFLGRLVDLAPVFIGTLTVVGLVISVVFTVQVAGFVDNYDDLVDPSRPRAFFRFATLHSTSDSMRGAGAYLAVLTVVALVALGSVAFRVPATRRIVGILWDVASFWPRSCHPLAPPCYAERTVPDLVTRISAHSLDPPGGPLVLAAHSQGTVISAASIEQLAAYDEIAGTAVVRGTALLTFGCVLRRLYGRYFPVYFGPPRLDAVQQLLTAKAGRPPRWRNLWRYTDYLGGQVTSGPPPIVPPVDAPVLDRSVLLAAPPVVGPARAWEWHSPDPPRYSRAPGDAAYSRPGRHSNFWADESGYFQLAAVELVAQITEET